VQVQRNGKTAIDLPATTRRNLELTQTLRGEESPTLFSLLDTCKTGMGSRAAQALVARTAARAQRGARAGCEAIGSLALLRRGHNVRARPQGQRRCRTHHRPAGLAAGAATRAGGAAAHPAQAMRSAGLLASPVAETLAQAPGGEAAVRWARSLRPWCHRRMCGTAAGGH